MKGSAVVASVLAWMMACVSIADAAETPGSTFVSIKGMHCAGCASKVTKKLQAVPNVKSASVDPEKGSAVVVTKETQIAIVAQQFVAQDLFLHHVTVQLVAVVEQGDDGGCSRGRDPVSTDTSSVWEHHRQLSGLWD